MCIRDSLDTRTMETEIEVANPDLALVPGMYANLALPVEHREHALSIPIQACLLYTSRCV